MNLFGIDGDRLAWFDTQPHSGRSACAAPAQSGYAEPVSARRKVILMLCGQR